MILLWLNLESAEHSLWLTINSSSLPLTEGWSERIVTLDCGALLSYCAVPSPSFNRISDSTVHELLSRTIRFILPYDFFNVPKQAFRYRNLITFITVPKRNYIDAQTRGLINIFFEATREQGVFKVKLPEPNPFRGRGFPCLSQGSGSQQGTPCKNNNS